MSKPTQLLTLCIFRDGENVLLAMKKRSFGAGRWNGYGGKLLEGETVEDALLREVKEESTVDLTEYGKRGEIIFHFPDMIHHVHVFEGLRWHGEPTETEEMAPKWYTTDTLPFDEMWPDDRHWFPYFLQRTPFAGVVEFSDDHKIISMDIKPV